MVISATVAFGDGGGVKEVNLNESKSQGVRHNAPGRSPFSCYVVFNELEIMSASTMCDVDIVVLNLDSGSSCEYVTDISLTPYVITLSGVGNYEITILTPDGHCYHGSFEVD